MAADTYEPPDHTRRGVAVLLGVLLLAGVALAGKFAYRLATRDEYVVMNGTMAPTLLVGDRIDCAKRVPAMLRRGSVVTVRRPEVRVVKRVVGLPGERIGSTADGRAVTVDGKPLAEPYADPGARPEAFAEVTVPEGHYFLMGDSRAASRDSRHDGPVPRADVVGVCSRIVGPDARRIPGTP